MGRIPEYENGTPLYKKDDPVEVKVKALRDAATSLYDGCCFGWPLLGTVRKAAGLRAAATRMERAAAARLS